MSVLAGVIHLCINDAGVQAAIGTRMEPVLLREQQLLPAATVHVIGGSSRPTLESSGPQKQRFQFDFYADSYAQADVGRVALRSLLEGYRGILQDESLLQNVIWIQDIDFFDNGPRRFRCAVEYYLQFNL